ncbi:hypothetical protein [Metarhizobium album]|uniref:hypothetical protein n=1 Tax=Metarhizobium album TaxID=2182425 RepID=UPI000FFE36C8|nr:hypothetical protein [Rhizobium album]
MIKPTDITHAYIEMTTDRIEKGFKPFILTFMFNQLSGGDEGVRKQMIDSMHGIYGHLLSRITRRPSKDLADLPLWVFCQDWPVPKDSKTTLSQASINDGCHVHAFVLLPPKTRGDFDLVRYVEEEQQKLIALDAGKPIERIHAVEVTETPERAAEYVIKSVDRKRIGIDGIECFPLARSEMTTLSNAERRDRAAKFNADKIVSAAENDNAPSVLLRESQIKLHALQRRLRRG